MDKIVKICEQHFIPGVPLALVLLRQNKEVKIQEIASSSGRVQVI